MGNLRRDYRAGPHPVLVTLAFRRECCPYPSASHVYGSPNGLSRYAGAGDGNDIESGSLLQLPVPCQISLRDARAKVLSNSC